MKKIEPGNRITIEIPHDIDPRLLGEFNRYLSFFGNKGRVFYHLARQYVQGVVDIPINELPLAVVSNPINNGVNNKSVEDFEQPINTENEEPKVGRTDFWEEEDVDFAKYGGEVAKNDY